MQNEKLTLQFHAVLNREEHYFLLSNSWYQLVNNFIEAMLSYLLKVGLTGLFKKDANLKLVYTIWIYQLKFESYMVANKHSISMRAGGHNVFTVFRGENGTLK